MRKMKAVKWIGWRPDEDVCGEAAMMAASGKFFDLVVTPIERGAVWDVIDGGDRIASEEADSVEEAKRKAETVARRALIRIVKKEGTS
ncbi:hypothetical protein AMK06_CH02025 [Rhizobium sp. N541]|uniref:hypothetical protein n=1 Tax=unclassified Rhizobium TaxID=2613769 RepID=UPI0007F107A1|nr:MULTISPECIES: hypothetical protein [unclassified Rhizobium]ANM16925.1 hypothetical protein AMK06_CH02025 [Rhizobium sp. N541]ANM23310.1 hypothetical protein AMK07_CH02022 [Rhizobium sp. N941]